MVVDGDAQEARGEIAQLVLDRGPRPLRGQQVDDVEIETVGQDRRGAPPVKRLGLLGRHRAHRGEHVGGADGDAFERVLGDDVDVARGLSGVLPWSEASGVLPRPASARPSMVACVVNTVPIAGACWLTCRSAVPAIHSCGTAPPACLRRHTVPATSARSRGRRRARTSPARRSSNRRAESRLRGAPRASPRRVLPANIPVNSTRIARGAAGDLPASDPHRNAQAAAGFAEPS